jgi:hypothetical protein
MHLANDAGGVRPSLAAATHGFLKRTVKSTLDRFFSLCCARPVAPERRFGAPQAEGRALSGSLRLWGSGSSANILQLFVFFAHFVVKELFPKKRLEKQFGLPKKFGDFNVKFRNFFGCFLWEQRQTNPGPAQPIRPLEIQGGFMQMLANEWLAKLRLSGQSGSVQVGKTSLQKFGLTNNTFGRAQRTGCPEPCWTAGV